MNPKPSPPNVAFSSSSSSSFDVVILSAFGRGQWLACALQSQGLEVALVDFFGFTQKWKPEDIEGPFGFFHSGLSSSQMDFLMVGDVVELSSVGFVFWLPSGPLELRGPLYFHGAQTLGLHEKVKRELQAQRNFSKKERKAWQESCLKEDFASFWPIYMAHQLSSSHLFSGPQFSCSGAEPLPLFSPFFIRYATANGYRRTLDYLSHKGVSVYTCTEAPDFSFVKKKPLKLAFIELEGGKKLKSTLFISTLSGEESYFISPQMGQSLWPKGFAKREWSWVRYRFRMEEGPQSAILPLHFALLQDPYAPWTHDNLALVQRTFFPQIFNLWLRLSSAKCFDASYLDRQVKRVLHFWQKNLLNLEMEVLDYPMEIEYEGDPSSLSPRPFSLFVPSPLQVATIGNQADPVSSSYSKTFKTLTPTTIAKGSNVLFHTPECYSRLDVNGRLQWEQKLLNRLLVDPIFSKRSLGKGELLFLVENQHKNRGNTEKANEGKNLETKERGVSP